MDKKNEALTNQKVKSLIGLDEEYTCSIKSLSIEKSSKNQFNYSIFKWENVNV